MSETAELNALLTSYSVQENALEESTRQKTEQYKQYQEALRDYTALKKSLLEVEEKRQATHARFEEALKKKDLLNKLLTTPNLKIKSFQKDISEIYQTMTQDSDDFINAVASSVAKLQNLGKEFDEVAIRKSKCDCDEKITALLQNIEEKQYKYDSLSTDQFEDMVVAFNSGKQLNGFYDHDKMSKMKEKILESEQQMLLMKKNIEFLQQRNQEAKMQLSAFSLD